MITGGANGIGLEYTRMALRSGGRVVMTDINTSLGERREKELQVIEIIGFHTYYCYRVNLVNRKLFSLNLM